MRNNDLTEDSNSTDALRLKNLFRSCHADWQANPSNSKIRMALLLFRISNWSLTLPGPLRAVTMPLRAVYKMLVGWIIGIDIPAATVIGPGLRIMHGTGLVVHADSVIGKDCTLRHGVTLGIRGASRGQDGAPRLGNSVNVGSGAQVLGPITLGDNTFIGAGAIVLHDVPAGKTAVGNPARLISSNH